MNIICTICSDALTPAENIYVTHCGHIFHHHCLAQWIERSKSCPQCRTKVTEKSMFRLYPTVSNEANIDDAGTLQTRLDDLHLKMQQQTSQVKAKEKEIEQLNKVLAKKIESLASYKEELATKSSAVTVLLSRMSYMKDEVNRLHKVASVNEALKKNIQTLNGLQEVLNGTTEGVETMLNSQTDIKTIAIFATALKRALTESEAKKVEYRNKILTLKQQSSVDKLNVTQLKAKVADLEEQLAAQENRYNMRKRKSPGTNQSHEAPDKRAKQPEPEAPPLPAPADLDTAVIVIDDDTDNTENSPYLKLKQCSVALTAASRLHSVPASRLKPTEQLLLNASHKPNRTVQSIFDKKRPLQADPGTSRTYDGLGGHSALDIFPVPKPKVPVLSAKHRLRRPPSCKTITETLNISKEAKTKSK